MKSNEIKNNWNKKIFYYMYITYNKSMIINNYCCQVFWVQFVIIKKNYTMTKLSLIISNMFFMTNGWNLPHHCVTSCPKWLLF